MPRRIFLHVGSPKTGTTFIQNVLWSGRQVALEQGLLLPLGTFHDHFLASVDVRERSSQEQFPPRAVGIWDRLAEEAHAWNGDVLVSHELFAGATAEQAARAVKSLGDTEVHVIVTARDLERQIPAEWQEHIKHRSTMTFTEFIHDLRTHAPKSGWFWTVQDCADVCRRWGAAVPPGNTHVVTVPRDAAPDLLWTRFAALVGLDPARFELESSPANTSLHAEQAELLRRVNIQLGDRLPMPGPYPQTVKDVLAQSLLAARPGTPVGLVGDDRQFAVARSQVIVDELRQLDVDVVGDLTDLLPADDPGPARGVTELPETTPDSVLLGESVEALSGLLERFGAERDRAADADGNRQPLESELSRCRGELDGLQARHDALQAHDDKLVHDMRYRPIRHLVIGVSERRPWLMRIRVGYWRTANAIRRVTRRTRSDRTG
ncbi:MAG: hypothetical protein M3O94_00890 [Actinomycetota bacterium]|nr:hypothetical protein [Actinomycetota bacterium]